MSVPDSEPLTPDDIFEILSNPRRRMVLYYLRTHDGDADVRELAKEIAAMENDVPIEELTTQQRKRVYVSLYQTHLPKMAQMNTIEYDKEAGTVSLSDQTTDIDDYLTDGEQADYPWTFHYIILAALSGTALALTAFDVAVFSTVPFLWLGVGVVALFTVSAIVQAVLRRQAQDIPFELSQYEK